MMTRRRRPHIPAPPNPVERREPLPWSHPKPAVEDAEAAARQRAIMAHPSYIEPDRDLDFLHDAITRGARLQLDYLKAEHAMVAQGIQRTIVVFGSTRLR